MDLRVGEAAIIEVQGRQLLAVPTPTAAASTIAIRFYKDGHASDGFYWTGAAWQAGAATVSSTQADQFAHDYAFPSTALIAGMERGRVMARISSATAYGETIWFDVVQASWITDAVYVSGDGASGTAYPLGLRTSTSDNIVDATAIAVANGVKRIVFIDGSYTLAQTYEQWTFEGETYAVIDMDGQTLTGSIFKQLTLTGSGNPTACFECALLNATFEGAFCFRTAVIGSTTLGDGATQLYMVDCFSDGAVMTLNDLTMFSRFGGNGTFAGLTTGTVDFAGLNGIFTIDNTCTGGTINLAGVFALTDNSGAGCTVTLSDGALSRTRINNGGPGLYEATIHVEDGAAAPLAAVKVHVFDSTNADPRWFGETDAAGDATFNLGAGTFSVRLAKGLTSFTSPETIVVTQDETFTLIGTSFVAPTAADPGDCAVYGTIWDSEGNPWAGVQIDVRATIDPQFVGDITMGDRPGTTRTSALGEFTIDLLKEAEVRFLVADAGIDFTKTVPDAASVDVKDWI